MKSAIFAIILLAGVSTVALQGPASTVTKILGITVEPAEQINNVKPMLGSERFAHEGKDYQAYWYEGDAGGVSLVSNYEEKETARGFFESNSCMVLASAGFYTASEAGKINQPIGLFVSNGVMTSRYQGNSLFNGVLSINSFGTPRISRTMPLDALRHAVQTGPILWENGLPQRLSLVRDKEARRVLAAVTGENKLIIMVVYSPLSGLGGPNLSDLPKILGLINERHELGVADAINLDGGSASAFFASSATGQAVNIAEASPVGSFFCFK